ncbi:hypothetical protein BUALT_Bualt04G0056900 [Buddleja alternifolia]|uniref:Trichome birefringence-like N-terminal domain-containing protein n=1 Tax=Buddleja alternifolia TaxID=168488 RepID=A0AAV6XMZ5_9LAMI|nr:hypothetical protein BUALT_Bualt04G0056900 [Buddleja alternifolia]
MKGGQFSRLWGRQFSLLWLLLFSPPSFFGPGRTTHYLSVNYQRKSSFVLHTPDLFVDDPADSLVLLNPKEHLTEEESHSRVAEGEENDKIVKYSDRPVDRTNRLSLEEKMRTGFRPLLLRSKLKLLGISCLESAVSLLNSVPITCNYAKGRWVADSRRPLYSGFGCKQFLSDMWACRLTQRTDFSYEGYRWQPNNCEMLEFQGVEFLRRMQDKTIAFVGDSLGRQQFQSLMCMATGGKEKPEIQDVGWKYGLVAPKGVVRPDGWAYWFPDTNTTILYYWSASLCGIEPINTADPSTEFAMHLDRPPTFLTRFLPQFHVVILNTGHHWNRGKLSANKWVMHANGKPVTDRKLAQMGNAKNYTVYSIVRWFDSQLPFYPQLKVFFRTISPRHFSNGDWNTGGRCDSLSPLAKGSEVFKDESSDPVVEGAVRGTRVKILDITAISELRDEGHISRYSIKASVGINDCLHWCLPGIPDTWNELLYAQL